MPPIWFVFLGMLFFFFFKPQKIIPFLYYFCFDIVQLQIQILVGRHFDTLLQEKDRCH